MTVKTHPAFELLRTEEISSLKVEYQEFRHTVTGAQHIHLASDNKENVFLVALRTVPEDSTGVAHILEHTALCGSEKYPVRDPFFMMIRRSLNTFMNAFTSSDWTAYPFASQNRKDFNNLLSVYLDSVFFARLDPLDFAQEGHRLEFETPEDPESDLTFKGVVYNEMKGAMSSINSTLWQTVTKYLYPTSTYHNNQFNIVGVENWGAGNFNKDGDLDKAMKDVDIKIPTILLSHDPSHWNEVVRESKYNIELQLSGHTHGMQFGIEIPGFKWSPAQYRYKEWAGLYKIDNNQVYVNRGLGHLGYAGRVGIMPDISVLNIISKV